MKKQQIIIASYVPGTGVIIISQDRISALMELTASQKHDICVKEN